MAMCSYYSGIRHWFLKIIRAITMGKSSFKLMYFLSVLNREIKNVSSSFLPLEGSKSQLFIHCLGAVNANK